MAHGMNPVELPCQPRGTQPRQVGGQSRGGGLLADADAENRCARAPCCKPMAWRKTVMRADFPGLIG